MDAKTAVDRVGRGKQRDIKAHFKAMASHYVFEPKFCNPAAGWEKGQVENPVLMMLPPAFDGFVEHSKRIKHSDRYISKSGSNLGEKTEAGPNDIQQVKYLNNIMEQDHRFIKEITRSMQTSKSCNSAAATLAGIEVAHMIRKGQFDRSGISGFALFCALAG
jgi:hypothetical protein